MYKLTIDVACINRGAVIMNALKPEFYMLLSVTINVESPGAGSELIATSNNRDCLERILLDIYGLTEDADDYIKAV